MPFCKQCGVEIKETAEFCPKCGAPRKGEIKHEERPAIKDNKWIVWGALGIIVLLIILGIVAIISSSGKQGVTTTTTIETTTTTIIERTTITTQATTTTTLQTTTTTFVDASTTTKKTTTSTTTTRIVTTTTNTLFDATKKLEECDRIEDQDKRDLCYVEVATYSREVGVCNRIDSDFRTEQCYANLAGVSSLFPSICDRMEYQGPRNMCYYNTAIEMKNASICNGVKDSQEKKDCVKYAS